MTSTLAFLPVGVEQVATEFSPWEETQGEKNPLCPPAKMTDATVYPSEKHFSGNISTTCATRLAPERKQDILLLFIGYLQNCRRCAPQNIPTGYEGYSSVD
jgi:hypothetical protein